MQKVALKKEEKILRSDCRIAKSYFSRFMGLMGKTSLPQDYALVFPKCNSIHTFFMHMSIDVLFLSEKGKVVSLFSALKPWRLVLPQKGALHTVEMAEGSIAKLGVKLGETLNIEGVC